jgi:hypothetical protein
VESTRDSTRDSTSTGIIISTIRVCRHNFSKCLGGVKWKICNQESARAFAARSLGASGPWRFG